MSRIEHLPPIKRIEGHGRVSLVVDDAGMVTDAHFDVVEFRGFEKFVQGRMVWEMPLVTTRVCGICPVSHHIAAVKAADDLLGAELPRPAKLLRELLHLAGFVHDHALHFFFLAGPDFLTGDGQSRDILGVIEAQPEFALKAIGIRKAGQRIVDAVGGQGHPVTAIAGGMSKPLDADVRDELLAGLRAIVPDALAAERLARETTLRLLAEHPGFAVDPTPYLAILGGGDAFELYDGNLAVSGLDGAIVDRFAPQEYRSRISERVLPHSYAKVPYLTALGPDDGTYRVGPLARVNLAESMPGEHSSKALADFRAELGRPEHATLAYHWARMIELVAVTERLEQLLTDPDITSTDVRQRLDRRAGVGVGIVEAPRGTLIHRYEADEIGRVTAAELIVATTNNNAAIDRTCAEAVRGVDVSNGLDEATRLRLERGIRAYDPCLSCATHEVGKMPLVIEVVGHDGRLRSSEGVR